MYPWRINFWMQKHSETSKGHPQYIFVVPKSFFHLSVISRFPFWFNKRFFLKSFFWTIKMQFWEICWNYLPENPCFFARWTKRSGNFLFNWNIHFLEVLFWTQKMKFWQTFRENFDKMPARFRSSSEIEKKKQFLEEHFLIRSFGHVECNFETFDEKISTNKRKAYTEYQSNVFIFVFAEEK